RGRLFLGIGGRDHFGIRGRIASEFAVRGHDLLLAVNGNDATYCTSCVDLPLALRTRRRRRAVD
ncbi:hypothetical protein GOA93_28095, partial [Sinorhizobium meliloti]|nr:hypothetical protein [Sinorhizobium meliloti]